MINAIAITCQNKKTISGHAGKCLNYLIYSILDNIIVKKEVLQLKPEEALHNTFHNPIENPNHLLFKVNVLLTGGIGLGGINRLKCYKVDAYVVAETNLDLAVNQFLEGTLDILNPTDAQPAGACGC